MVFFSLTEGNFVQCIPESVLFNGKGTEVYSGTEAMKLL